MRQPTHHLLEFLIGTGDVYRGESHLATVRYDLRRHTSHRSDSEREVEGRIAITGTLNLGERVQLPAMTELILILEDEQELPFVTMGTGPEYAVLPVGDVG